MVEVDAELKELLLSDSSLGLFAGCSRKFEFRKLFKGPRGDDSVPAMAGKSMHIGYQHYLAYRDVDKAIFEMMKAYNISLIAKPWQADWSLEGCYATLMQLIMNSGMSEYQLAKVKVGDEERFATEVPFKIRFLSGGVPFQIVPNLCVSYIGYMDALMYNLFDDSFFVVDVKTTRQNLSDFTPRFKFSEQCIPYQLVIEFALGRKLDGLSIRYLAAFVDVRQPKVQIYPFEKTLDDVQDWLKGVLVKLNMMKMYMGMDWWPRNSGHCITYNQPCQYLEPCASRDKHYLKTFFDLGRDQVYYEHEFNPWFVLDLEIGEVG